MQGDHVALRSRPSDEIESWRDGQGRERLRTAPLRVDDHGIATLDRDSAENMSIAFRLRGGRVWLGTNAYFFATAAQYEDPQYGEFRMDVESGEAVLVDLRDADLDLL